MRYLNPLVSGEILCALGKPYWKMLENPKGSYLVFYLEISPDFGEGTHFHLVLGKATEFPRRQETGTSRELFSMIIMPRKMTQYL